MKNKGITVVIAILAVILAGLVGLLVYLEMGRSQAQVPSAPETQASSAAESTGTAVEDTASAETEEEPTFETEGEADATPMVPVGDPEMDPQGATEGPQVDPTLGQDETKDPDENELPMVG